MPLFSTILTSFNRADMLKNAVKSVKLQTFSDWQLIIGDSSTLQEQRDAIKEYGEALEKEDPRIIFRQYRAWTEEERARKVEYATKINKLYKLATGDWVTHLNDDDLYHVTYYQAYKDVMDAIPEAKVIYTGQYAVSPDGKLQYALPAKDIKRSMFFCVDQNCVAHKREIFDEVGGWCTEPYVSTYADAEFWWRISEAGYLAYATGKVTSIKMIHQGQISSGAEIPYDERAIKETLKAGVL